MLGIDANMSPRM